MRVPTWCSQLQTKGQRTAPGNISIPLGLWSTRLRGVTWALWVLQPLLKGGGTLDY